MSEAPSPIQRSQHSSVSRLLVSKYLVLIHDTRRNYLLEPKSPSRLESRSLENNATIPSGFISMLIVGNRLFTSPGTPSLFADEDNE